VLISSPRHRPEDLELWRDLEEADLQHFEVLRRSGRIEQSLEAIRNFAESPCYCSVSWGKDSVVLAHLWHSVVGTKYWSVWHARRERSPETEMVEKQFLSRYELRYARLMFQSNSAVSEYERLTRANRYLTGIRSEESSQRKISAAVHGVATDNACRPLLRWANEDVFSYLAHYQLPVHPVYAMLGAGRWSRKHLRVEILGGSEGSGAGRTEWEREYYGDVIRRLEANK